MASIKRYLTAFNRYRSSKGFGIHSPFAFRFVLGVLREKTAYYVYDRLDSRRRVAIACRCALRSNGKVISRKSLRMVFRIVNCFNPQEILMFGASYGMSACSALAVDSRSRMWLCEQDFQDAVVSKVVGSNARSRISVFRNAADAISAYEDARSDRRPFVMVNSLSSGDCPAVENWLHSLKGQDAVIVVRNLQRCPAIASLWTSLSGSFGYGMGFSNGKIGVYVALRHLPTQNFNLWF